MRWALTFTRREDDADALAGHHLFLCARLSTTRAVGNPRSGIARQCPPRLARLVTPWRKLLQRYACFYAKVVATVLFVTWALPVSATSGYFTDSRGRTLAYRLAHDWDRETPRGVVVVVQSGTTTSLDDFVNEVDLRGRRWPYLSHDLAYAEVAPPTAREPFNWADLATNRHNVAGVRGWINEDVDTLHELLQSHFDGSFSVDLDRVVFVGGSAGAEFLNRFVQIHGEHYGGGLVSQCAHHALYRPDWSPSAEFKAGFRVFVQSTLDDFLYGGALASISHYRYAVGIETKADIHGAGGHCAPGAIPRGDAVDWILTGEGLSADPAEPHFVRVSSLDGIAGIAADRDGSLWLARLEPDQSSTTVWRSVDRGRSLERMSEVPSNLVFDMDAAGDALVLTTYDGPRWRGSAARLGFYRSTDRGRSFQPLEGPGTGSVPSGNSYPTTTDRDGRIYVAGNRGRRASLELYRSDDLGDSWISLGAPDNMRAFGGLAPLVGAEDDRRLVVLAHAEYDDAGRASSPEAWVGMDRDWLPVANLPPRWGGLAWDGRALWTFGSSARVPSLNALYRSSSLGRDWTEVEASGWGIGGSMNIVPLGHGEVLVGGGGRNGDLRHADNTRTSVWGGVAIAGQRSVAVDHTRGDVFITDGSAVYRLDGQYRAANRTEGFADRDGDGISDPLDAFPDNGSEYLDTDGDGMGNVLDGDDDQDGIPDANDGAPLDPYSSVDTDGDGVGDWHDGDNDGDGVVDLADAFPLLLGEHVDSDGDGVGDFADADDDGDGVADRIDAFPLYPHEWLDTDGDGIGDNLDDDDDNDGLRDAEDPASKEGVGQPNLMRNVRLNTSHRLTGLGFAIGSRRPVSLTSTRPAGIKFPEPRGRSGALYGDLNLGNSAGGGPLVMVVDNLTYPALGELMEGESKHRLMYLDRNNNGDLTDDGPPIPTDNPRVAWSWHTRWAWTQVRYSTGDTLPYYFRYDFSYEVDGQPFWRPGPNPTAVVLQDGGPLIGKVSVGDGMDVVALPVDDDLDGVFTGERDYVCIDVDGDGDLACWQDDLGEGSERFRSGDLVSLPNGQQAQVSVDVSGYRVEVCRPHCAPALAGRVPEPELTTSETLRIDLAAYFVAGDGGALTYAATSSDPSLVAVAVRGTVLIVQPLDDRREGQATITVVATDSIGLTTTLSFDVTVRVAPPDHGDSLETATLLPIGPPIAGTVSDTSDKDVFRIDLQGSAMLEVRTSGPTDVRGELLDGTGTMLATDDDNGPGGHNFLVRTDLEAGIYYVAVSGEPGDYAVMARLGDAPDHGETEATATLLTLYAEADLNRVSPSALLAAPGKIAPTSADVDVFRLDVPFDATDVTIRSAGGTDVFGRLLDAGMTELASDVSDGNFRMETTLDAGTYYVVVTGSETGTYRVLAWGDSATCRCADAPATRDHGDDAENATLMPIGPPVAGMIGDSSDVDMFRIDLQGSATLEVRTSGPTDTRGELLDGTGARILSDDNSGPAGHNFLVRADLEAGIYYVAVTGEPGDYAVMARLGDAPDHGDTASLATLLTLYAEADLARVSPSALLAAPGKIAPTDADVDVFRLDVHEPMDVTVRSAGGTDVTGRLLDSSLTEIAADDSEGNFRMEASLDPGIYYVEVGGRETGTYRVLAWGESTSPCDCTGR